MYKFTIMTDSCADLPLDIVEQNKIVVIPMEVSIADKTFLNYPDESGMSTSDFYDLMREKEIAHTSQISAETFVHAMKPLLEQGEDILAICFSSALSGTYDSEKAAVEKMQKKFPERQIILIDSLSASVGQGFYVYQALLKRDEGSTLSEVAAYLESIKLHIGHLFTVDDLGVLKRGGRLSASAAFLGAILQFKPVLHVSDEGKLVPVTKVRGRKNALKKMEDLFDEQVENAETIFIGHGDDLVQAERLRDQLKENHPEIKHVLITPIGPTIGAHSGPGTIALFFLAKIR